MVKIRPLRRHENSKSGNLRITNASVTTTSEHVLLSILANVSLATEVREDQFSSSTAGQDTAVKAVVVCKYRRAKESGASQPQFRHPRLKSRTSDARPIRKVCSSSLYLPVIDCPTSPKRLRTCAHLLPPKDFTLTWWHSCPFLDPFAGQPCGPETPTSVARVTAHVRRRPLGIVFSIIAKHSGRVAPLQRRVVPYKLTSVQLPPPAFLIPPVTLLLHFSPPAQTHSR